MKRQWLVYYYNLYCIVAVFILLVSFFQIWVLSGGAIATQLSEQQASVLEHLPKHRQLHKYGQHCSVQAHLVFPQFYSIYLFKHLRFQLSFLMDHSLYRLQPKLYQQLMKHLFYLLQVLFTFSHFLKALHFLFLFMYIISLHLLKVIQLFFLTYLDPLF